MWSRGRPDTGTHALSFTERGALQGDPGAGTACAVMAPCDPPEESQEARKAGNHGSGGEGRGENRKVQGGKSMACRGTATLLHRERGGAQPLTGPGSCTKAAGGWRGMDKTFDL